ncbi:hypothetical protein M419DRAFT_123830 [Trichoderma reesei RUT C-30]|uniref:Uncharacterized protein n=1 Tax=Hypocrea jecorina (strain ATCC 56765 / BCRC 32924 / NRRL 11460 / Rut C-30) TaxID=1344414 RepID=A0A024S6Q0_HYPJR|nr:hypothetical protein M419DRAFT_123830 [Trichoderma reesei RUT C-30]
MCERGIVKKRRDPVGAKITSRTGQIGLEEARETKKERKTIEREKRDKCKGKAEVSQSIH